MLRDAADAVADAAPELATELALWSLFTGLQGGWDERLFTAGQSILERDRLGRAARALRGRRWSTGCPPTSPATPRRPAHASPRRSRPGRAWTACGRWPCRSSCGRSPATGRTRASTARASSPGCAPRARVAAWPGVLPLLAFTELAERRIREAQASVAEGLELARALGYENDETGLLGVQARIAALHGDADACRENARGSIAPQRRQRHRLGDDERAARPRRARAGPRGPARGDRPFRADRPHARPRPSS